MQPTRCLLPTLPHYSFTELKGSLICPVSNQADGSVDFTGAGASGGNSVNRWGDCGLGITSSDADTGSSYTAGTTGSYNLPLASMASGSVRLGNLGVLTITLCAGTLEKFA